MNNGRVSVERYGLSTKPHVLTRWDEEAQTMYYLDAHGMSAVNVEAARVFDDEKKADEHANKVSWNWVSVPLEEEKERRGFVEGVGLDSEGISRDGQLSKRLHKGGLS